MSYKPPYRHTPAELDAARLADCEADLAHSVQHDPLTDEWQAYQEDLRRQIKDLRKEDFDVDEKLILSPDDLTVNYRGSDGFDRAVVVLDGFQLSIPMDRLRRCK